MTYQFNSWNLHEREKFSRDAVSQSLDEGSQQFLIGPKLFQFLQKIIHNRLYIIGPKLVKFLQQIITIKKKKTCTIDSIS
jgi:hypothetical protein